MSLDLIIGIVSAIVLDLYFGEPKRFHPLVYFGNCALFIESKFNKFPTKPSAILFGILTCCMLILPPTLLAQLISQVNTVSATVINIALLYFSLGNKSLVNHIKPIHCALQTSNLDQARYSVSRIVSRDCDQMNSSAVRKAAIESTLENGLDAVLAPVFWFVLFGGPGALLYRLCNTLDAMWGYRTSRYEFFGKFCANLDDWLNYIPARLVAVSYGMLGNGRQALAAVRHQSQKYASPNAGPVMAAGAGSLNIELGGNAMYRGTEESRAALGYGNEPTDNDVLRALSLVQKTLALWCGLIFIAQLVWMVLA